jgi:divalent metal cation (Fe/Co/Zn/Cd) transporter
MNRRDQSRRKGKKVAEFYNNQNERIDTLLKPLSTLSAEGAQEVTDNAYRIKLAVNISFGFNCILAVLQLYAAITSGSLALFATMVDSVFDPIANLILWLAHRAANKAEDRKWPLGGSRFETAGNIVFAQIMAAVNLVLVVQSITEFVGHDGSELDSFNLTSVAVVAVAFAIKLGLFIMCFAIRKWSSQVQTLWEDHRNDLFT